jgi:Bifunctional DNA primase/polymerase, N-terminal/AAA domain
MAKPKGQRRQAAEDFAAAGFKVFPCFSYADNEDDCTCFEYFHVHPDPVTHQAAKHPLIKDWPNRATVDAATVSEWWRKNPNANVAVKTGDKVTVLDFDGQEGSDTLKLLAERGLPETVKVRSGSGGTHLWYKTPAYLVRNHQRVQPGMDIRGVGGYVIAPPSIHKSGKRYEFVPGHELSIGLAELPAWFEAWYAEQINRHRLEHRSLEERFMEEARLKREEVKTLWDIMHTKHDPIVWTVEQHFPEGVSLVAAPAKTGKSTMVMQIGCQNIRGQRFCGFKTQKGSVFYVDVEGDDGLIHERTAALYPDWEAWKDKQVLKNFYVVGYAPSIKNGLLTFIDKQITEHPDIKCVVLDPWSALQGIQQKGTDLVKEDYDNIAMLSTYAKHKHISVIIIMHTVKALKDDPLSCVGGTGGIVAAADAIHVIARPGGGEVAKWFKTGRRVIQETRVAEFGRNGWEYVGMLENWGDKLDPKNIRSLPETEEDTESNPDEVWE